MQDVLIIINAPPYGSERCLSGLRLAAALAEMTLAADKVITF